MQHSRSTVSRNQSCGTWRSYHCTGRVDVVVASELIVEKIIALRHVLKPVRTMHGTILHFISTNISEGLNTTLMNSPSYRKAWYYNTSPASIPERCTWARKIINSLWEALVSGHELLQRRSSQTSDQNDGPYAALRFKQICVAPRSE